MVYRTFKKPSYNNTSLFKKNNNKISNLIIILKIKINK